MKRRVLNKLGTAFKKKKEEKKEEEEEENRHSYLSLHRDSVIH